MYWVAEVADGLEVRRYRQVRWEAPGFALYNPGIGLIPGCQVDLTRGHLIPGLFRFHLYGEGTHQNVHFLLDWERGTLVADHLAQAEGGSQWKWEPFAGAWNPIHGRLLWKARVAIDGNLRAPFVPPGASGVRMGLSPARTYHLGFVYDDWSFKIVSSEEGKLLAVKREPLHEQHRDMDLVVAGLFDTAQQPAVERAMQEPEPGAWAGKAPGLPVVPPVPLRPPKEP